MIHTLLDFLRSLTSPEGLRQLLSHVFSGWLGYAALCAIVFSETGLLVGFFLPGDSLLFTVGVVAGDGVLNIALVIPLLAVSAMIGDSTGYLLGRRTVQRSEQVTPVDQFRHASRYQASARSVNFARITGIR